MVKAHPEVKKWTEQLVGRTITKVRHLTDAEANILGWYKRPPVLHLDDGTLLIAQMDDEGNDGGTILRYHNEEEEKNDVMFVLQ